MADATPTTSNPGTQAVDAKGSFLTALNTYQNGAPANPVNPSQVAPQPAASPTGALPQITVPQYQAPQNVPAEAANVNSAYQGAANTYLSMLPALQVKYQNLYNQLEAEKANAITQNAALSGTEQTQQKKDLASRGLEVSSGNSYFANEQNKLVASQTQRDQNTALGYSGKEVDLSGQATTESQGIADKLAGLTTENAKAVQSIVDTTNSMKQAQKFHDDAIKQAKEAAKATLKQNKQSQTNWDKTFAYTKTKDAADRALEMYKANKTAGNSAADASYLDNLNKGASAITVGTDGYIDPAEFKQFAVDAVKNASTVASKTLAGKQIALLKDRLNPKDLKSDNALNTIINNAIMSSGQ